MKIYTISMWLKGRDYDHNYSSLYNHLREQYNGHCWSDNFWFIESDKSAADITNDIITFFYKTPRPTKHNIVSDDVFFVSELGNDYNGFYFKDAFTWIKEHKDTYEVCRLGIS